MTNCPKHKKSFGDEVDRIQENISYGVIFLEPLVLDSNKNDAQLQGVNESNTLKFIGLFENVGSNFC